MFVGDMLIQLFQIYNWRWPPFFLEIRNIELRNWSDDSSLNFTVPPLTIPEFPGFLIRFLPDSYLMKEELTPDKVSNPQKVFGNPSQYLEWLCRLSSLTNSQEKTLAALLLGFCADLLEKSDFLLLDADACKSLEWGFPLSAEKTVLDKVILPLLNPRPRKNLCPLRIDGFWGRELARKGCWSLAAGLLCNPGNNTLDFCFAFVTLIDFSSNFPPNK